MIPFYSRLYVIAIISVAILGLDFLIGPYIVFPLAFLLPVCLTAWWHGRRVANVLTVVMIIVRFFDALYWQPAIPNWVLYALVNSFVRLAVLLLLAYLTARVAEQQRMLQREVKILRGLLPICGHCKKIRTNKGEWEQLEEYITEKSEATFSHAICPDCRKQYFGHAAVRKSDLDLANIT